MDAKGTIDPAGCTSQAHLDALCARGAVSTAPSQSALGVLFAMIELALRAPPWGIKFPVRSRPPAQPEGFHWADSGLLGIGCGRSSRRLLRFKLRLGALIGSFPWFNSRTARGLSKRLQFGVKAVLNVKQAERKIGMLMESQRSRGADGREKKPACTEDARHATNQAEK